MRKIGLRRCDKNLMLLLLLGMLVMAACKTFPYLIAEPAAVEPKTSLSSTE